MKLIHTLIICLLLFSACTKTRVEPKERDYFIGEWQISNNPVSADTGITVTFHESGAAIYNLDVTGPSAQTRYWVYNETNREFTFYAPEEKYVLVEKTPSLFKLIRAESGNMLIFTKK